MAGIAADGAGTLVLAGPSGVGKGTLINKLKAEYGEVFGFSVSHTTRDPRPGEVDKVHYNFVKKELMEKEIEDGLFLESANVHGNFYGTSIAAVQKVVNDGQVCILDIDIQGVRSCRKAELPGIYVFIVPPCMEELEARLRGRGTETEDKILKRMENAKGEVREKDEPGLFDHQIVNDDIDEAYAKLRTLLTGCISKVFYPLLHYLALSQFIWARHYFATPEILQVNFMGRGQNSPLKFRGGGEIMASPNPSGAELDYPEKGPREASQPFETFIS
ncbi:P-loop containing nucleoside triphosphate hydrolase protein [Baffinella frigidus]|nr:P-loop containing nucleoside triphosphate hydrolase protein [Cryptophyta sp. CCMP2293]